MRLARVGAVGEEVPVVLSGEIAYDLRGIVSDINPDALRGGALSAIAASFAEGSLPILERANSLRFGPPIARPGALVCVGLNYAAHAAESRSTVPDSPVIFYKTPSSIGGPDDIVNIPRGSSRSDWEVELGVVIGRRALYLDSIEMVADYIAGYLAADDVSEREYQLDLSGGQWSKGKSFPGFSPLGPWLVTPDEVDPSNLRLRSWVNGEPRQDSTTADMIFSVEAIIWHLSQFMALEPGDVILTGTPAGVGLSGRFPYLKPGDVVEIEIDGLGRQRHEFAKA
ncbi:fumarylacetoacetate hydrolase family protein [Salinibacterium sp. CAN_S4]|uniref:fumarylacetoacetate hydrolase family protein n=1 Tax=Salinibacterium sp. CAN_S4 TaxID=2787727 RepID=UPI0018F00A5A